MKDIHKIQDPYEEKWVELISLLKKAYYLAGDIVKHYDEKQEYEKVLSALNVMLKINDDPDECSRLYLMGGGVCESMEKYDDASRWYKEGILREPDDRFVEYFLHNNLGFCMNKCGHYAQAEVQCRKAIDIDPERYNAYKNLGLALENQSDFKTAANMYITAVQKCPEDARACGHLEAMIHKHRELLDEMPELVDLVLECQELVARSEME